MLLPNDVVFIPDIRPKEVKEPTNQVHKFQMKGEKHLHWIEIELIGEDDKPIPNEKFKIILSDGSEKEGNLDENGWARVEISSTAECEVTFPKIDEEAWKFIEAVGAKNKSS